MKKAAIKKAKIKVDFFMVKVDGSYHSFKSMIERVNALPDDESKSLSIDEYSSIRLQKVFKSDDFYQGDIVRIKMDDIPSKASVDSSIAGPISLQDNEGIGRETAFLFHVPSGILLIQRTVQGVSDGNFVRYFKEKCEHDLVNFSLELYPIIDSDVMRRIAKIKRFKSIKLKVNFAPIDKGAILAKENLALSSMAEIHDYFNAPYVNVEIKVSRDKNSGLNKENIISTFNDLLDMIRNPIYANVLKASTAGIRFDGEEDTINLLEYTMRSDISIPYPGRYLSYEHRKKALIDAWAERLEELKIMFSNIR
jgi:hypothetical protein